MDLRNQDMAVLTHGQVGLRHDLTHRTLTIIRQLAGQPYFMKIAQSYGMIFIGMNRQKHSYK